jgi:23S rRNA (uracil1939-C5)-methyltransferase
MTAQVVLVGNTERLSLLQPVADALLEDLGPLAHSLFLNGNPERNNSVLGPHFSHVHGPPAVSENIGGAEVFFPPAAFGQSHLNLADALVHEVHARVPPSSRILELYAGCGSIGMGLVGRSLGVCFNELAPGGLEGLQMGIAHLSPSLAERVQVRPGPAASAASAIAQSEVVVVDPPRRGLDPEVVKALWADPPKRLLYVACGIDAFVRDLEDLTGDGRLHLKEILAFDLFPHTGHVELLGCFESGQGGSCSVGSS